MKLAATVIVLLVAIHILLLTGGGFWLAVSGRLNLDRLHQVVDVFRDPVAVTERAAAEADAAATEALELQAEIARLEEGSDGPKRLEDRLADKLEGDDFAVHRLERMKQESDAIRDRLDQDRAYIDEQLAKLDAERAEFAAVVEGRLDGLTREDFDRAVQTLEQLKAAQAKAVVRELVATGEKEQAVAYLAAMDLRKSAGVLKQFKGDDEAREATELIEAIRKRRSVSLRDSLAAAGTDAGNAGEPAP